MASPRSLGGIVLPGGLDIALIARGLAASAVVWWHVKGFAADSSLEQMLTTSGRFAVWVFFVLSGYLISSGFFTGRYAFDGESLKAFFRNRFLRIYPLFLIVTIATWFFALSQGTAPTLSVEFFLREVLMLQWTHAYSLNGVFWTLGVEIQFYLIAPLLIWLQMRTRSRAIVTALAYIALLGYMLFENRLFPGATGDARYLLGNMVHFQAGIVCAALAPRLQRIASRWRKTLWLGGAIALAGMLLVANALYFKNNPAFLGLRGILLVDGFAFLILVAHIIAEEQRRNPGKAGDVLLALGNLSYGLYAWHGSLMVFAIFKMNFALTFLGALAASYVTYRFCERPLLRLKVRTRPHPV